MAAAYALAGQTDKAGKKSPLLLLAAAKVIGTTEFRELKPGKDDKITSTPVKVDPKEEAGALIEEALVLAKDDEAVKAMAAAVRKEIAGFRGGINGPYSFNGRVDAKYDKSDDFYVELRGGQQTRMSVANLSNAGDIDLKVYDLDNRLVAQDTRAAGGAYVQFTPPKNNRYRVVIVLYAGPNKPLNYRFSHN